MLWALWGFGKGIFGATALLRHKGKTAFQLLENRHMQNSEHPNVNCFTIISSLLLIFCLSWSLGFSLSCMLCVPSHRMRLFSTSANKAFSWDSSQLLNTRPFIKVVPGQYCQDTAHHHTIYSELPASWNTNHSNHFTVSDSHVLFWRHFDETATKNVRTHAVNPLPHAVFQGLLAQRSKSHQRWWTGVWTLVCKLFRIPSSAGRFPIVLMPLREKKDCRIFCLMWNRVT